MQIRVKSLAGSDEYVLQVEQDQLVSSLKVSISERPNGPPPARQKLVFKGRTMQDSARLAEYQLEEDCKVHLIIQRDPVAPSSSGADSQQQQQQQRGQGSPCPMDTSAPTPPTPHSTGPAGTAGPARVRPPNRLEPMLRERLSRDLPSHLVNKIIANLYHDIDEDIEASSLDDIERLAKQKLGVTLTND